MRHQETLVCRSEPGHVFNNLYWCVADFAVLNPGRHDVRPASSTAPVGDRQRRRWSCMPLSWPTTPPPLRLCGFWRTTNVAVQQRLDWVGVWSTCRLDRTERLCSWCLGSARTSAQTTQVIDSHDFSKQVSMYVPDICFRCRLAGYPSSRFWFLTSGNVERHRISQMDVLLSITTLEHVIKSD